MSNFKFQISNFKLLSLGYLLVIISLFFYSFTQVDLGLTLTEWSVWQVFQRFFQHIGYFQRPLSTFFFVTIVILLYVFYALFLYAAKKELFTKKQVWTRILIASTILFFSYNAFSYDLFNYIFDAKIVTYYHQNPYEHKALDYPGDIMLSFMHWTHRTYPYGPLWLILSIPLSFVGYPSLLLTMMLFKALSFGSFLGTAFFIGKILKKIAPKRELFGIVFFALNPLVLIEGLVSAHNDMVMIFLSIWAIYLLMEEKYFRSFILLICSIGVKFATVFLIPIFFLFGLAQWKKMKANFSYLFLGSVLCMLVPLVAASVRTNFQPWYLLYVLPFAVLATPRYFIVIPSVTISLLALLQYAPFLYLGNWNPPVPTLLSELTVSSIVVSLLFTLGWYVKTNGFFKKT